MSAFRRLVQQWFASDDSADRTQPARTRLGLTALEAREVPASLATLFASPAASFSLSAAPKLASSLTLTAPSPVAASSFTAIKLTTPSPIIARNLITVVDPIKRAAELASKFDTAVVVPANPSLDKGTWYDAGDGIGKIQYFTGGVFLWSQATGIHAVTGKAYQAWTAAGGLSAFGYPVTEMTTYGVPQKVAFVDMYAAYQKFQRGTLSTPPVGALSAVTGPLHDAYWAAGGPTGSLGAALSNVVTGTGGQYAKFERGAIAWTAAAGAHVLNGAIADLWLNIDRGLGPVGFPIGDEKAAGSGRMVAFQRGIITDSAATGAHEVHGAILGEYLANGGPAGFLGLPTTDETTTPDGIGRFNHFQGGSVYWSPGTGAHEVHGAIRDKWASLGWERSPLGYPTSNETAGPNGSRISTFQNGIIVWSSATGAHALYGPVLDKYRAEGGAGGRLGLPTTDVTALNGSTTQVALFQRGIVVKSPGSNAVALSGPIYDRWAGMGGFKSRLGVPTSDEPTSGSVRTVTFTGGSLTWTDGKGITSVQLRGNFQWYRNDPHATNSGMDAAQRLLVAWGVSSTTIKDPTNSGWLTRQVLGRFGLDATPKEVTAALNGVRGIPQLYTDTSFDFLKSVLMSGRPVIALVNTIGHFTTGDPHLGYVTLVGINTTSQTLTYVDYTGRAQTIPYASFLKQWNWYAGNAAGDYLTGNIGVKSRTMIYYAG